MHLHHTKKHGFEIEGTKVKAVNIKSVCIGEYIVRGWFDASSGVAQSCE